MSMPADTASLLTQTQRERIEEDFEGLSAGETSRDQARIRTRLAAGLQDFERLATYPDDQLELALSSYGDDETIEALANGRILLDRLTTVKDIEREQVTRRANDRLETIDKTDENLTLRDISFEPASDTRERIETEIASTNRLERYTDRLLRTAAWSFLPIVAMWLFDTVLDTNLLSDLVYIFGILVYIGGFATFCGLSIKLLQAVKYDVLPLVQSLPDDPDSARNRLTSIMTAVYERLIVRPVGAARGLWGEL